jgi:cytochrome c biogenesis protein
VSESTQNIRPEVNDIPIGPLGWLRWFWRQLTTMRVALQLLFLLALASIPGSVFPQRTQSQIKVREYLADNPDLGLWLDRLGMFDVYGSVWFTAIYVLLMISLMGCIIPRTKVHLQASIAKPPRSPKNLNKFENYVSFTSSVKNLDAVLNVLKQSKYRVRVEDDHIAGEKGYLRETGNLLFHIALLLILIAVAIGSLFGYRGQIIIREGVEMTNVLAQYDTFAPGALFNTDWLEPFNVELDRLEVDFELAGNSPGQALDFRAYLNHAEAGGEKTSSVIGVNSPLDIGNASMFLLGHGYAPVVEIKDKAGNVVFRDSVIFLPQDGNFLSTGVIKVPDMNPQYGFDGIFAPTAAINELGNFESIYPDVIDPILFIAAFQGDLGLDDGVPQNVFQLNTDELKQVGMKSLSLGDTWDFEDGSISFVRIDRFATFNIASDPGQNFALLAALLAIIGVTASLYVQRRRVWVRFVPQGEGYLVELAMISRHEDEDLESALLHINSECQKALGVEEFTEEQR